MKTPTVFFDLETAGLEDHHADIQLAAVAVHHWEVIGSFEYKIEFDMAKADVAALRINSWNPNVWREKAVPEEKVVMAFADFLEKYRVLSRISRRGHRFSVARLAGHNVTRFDAPRLLRMFKRNRNTFLPADVFLPLDTMQLALWYFAEAKSRPENFQLPTLCEFFRIDTENAHDAVADVCMIVELARHLTQGLAQRAAA